MVDNLERIGEILIQEGVVDAGASLQAVTP